MSVTIEELEERLKKTEEALIISSAIIIHFIENKNAQKLFLSLMEEYMDSLPSEHKKDVLNKANNLTF